MTQEFRGNWRRNHEHYSEDTALKFGRIVLLGQGENLRIKADTCRCGREEPDMVVSAFLVKEVGV